MVTLPTYHICLICTAIESPPQGALFSPGTVGLAVKKITILKCAPLYCYSKTFSLTGYEKVTYEQLRSSPGARIQQHSPPWTVAPPRPQAPTPLLNRLGQRPISGSITSAGTPSNNTIDGHAGLPAVGDEYP